MLSWFCGDLHIHTVLSPCAELSMGPKDIVQKALEIGLDIIAITDHNSAQNVSAVQEAAQDTDLTVIPGMEVSTREEIHMICLFPDICIIQSFQDYVYKHLTPGENDASFWGPQLIVDANENILGEETHLLAFPTQIPYETMMQEVVSRGGIVYPAHIDRRSNSIVRTLGFLPNNLPFKVVEVSSKTSPEQAAKRYGFGDIQVMTASDAHDISQLGTTRTFFRLERADFSELLKACIQEAGRKISLFAPIESEKCENVEAGNKSTAI